MWWWIRIVKQLYLPCSTWRGSARLLRRDRTEQGLCCTLQRQFASLLTEIILKKNIDFEKFISLLSSYLAGNKNLLERLGSV